ncbi:MAG: L-seryl-tRNA(Sec) selenium transferase [Myxococcota bacterium]
MDGPQTVNARYRQLPAVERLVSEAGEGTDLARWSLLAAARSVLAEARRAIAGEAEAQGNPPASPLAARTRALASRLERDFPRRVLNATGVVVHTNLGRAPLAPEAARAAVEAATVYSDLELDLERGERGSRLSHVSQLLTLLSGAEAALVVNNNAAALLLAVDTLAAGREVVLSRGELIEIGGSFRLPEILGASRARLREIGTTNRTHLRDYAQAIGPETGLILKVHRSCFEMRGFTSDVPLRELAQLAREHGVPLVEDRGSGTLLDLRTLGLPEDRVEIGLEQGADLVLFSGDKLLGGPQAGIVLGRGEPIERMRRSPLARALRVDKLTLAALGRTLRILLEGRGPEALPVLRMLLAGDAEIRARAEWLAKELGREGVGDVSVEEGRSRVGGGALPELELASPVVRVQGRVSAAELARRLRTADPPLLVRVQRDALILDPRTLEESDLPTVVKLLRRASH